MRMIFCIVFLFSVLMSIAQVPTNDLCDNPIITPLPEYCGNSSFHVDLTNATSTNRPNSCDATAIDVWYEFTTTSNQVVLRAQNLDFYGTELLYYEVYENNCEVNATPINCNYIRHNTLDFITNLDIGSTYLLRLWTVGGNKADVCLRDACSLEVISTATSACDPSDNTFDLEMEIAYLGGNSGDVLTVLTDQFSEDIIFNSVNDTLTFTFSDLPSIGVEVYAFIRNNNATFCDFQDQNLYTAPSPCVPPPANDSCHTATFISDLSVCNPIVIDINGATPEDNLITVCGDDEPNVWYSFQASSETVELQIINDDEIRSLSFEVYESACPNFSEPFLECTQIFGGQFIQGLTVGNTYYIQFVVFGGSRAEVCLKSACSLDILSFVTSTCDPTTNTYSIDLEVATNNISIGDSLVIDLNNVVSKFELTKVADTSFYTITGLPATDLDVWAQLETEGNAFCQKNWFALYQAPEPCIDHPSNDSIHQATYLDLQNCELQAVNTFGATIEDGYQSCGAPELFTLDVWYSFTAISPITRLNVLNLPAGSAIGFRLYERVVSPVTALENCTGFSRTGQYDFPNLQIGELYVIQIALSGDFQAEICLEAIDICNNNSINLQRDTIGEATYRTTQNITSIGKVISTVQVNYLAANSILLEPGFEVESNATFCAVIEDCSTSAPSERQQGNPKESQHPISNSNIEPITFLDNIPLAVRPNPFNNIATIEFTLEKQTPVRLAVFSANGVLVESLIPNDLLTSGNYSFDFSPRTYSNQIYFVVLTTNKGIEMKKLIYLNK